MTAAEAEALRARDLALAARKDGSFRLLQGCRGLEGRRCGLYADRPAPCRAYACLLATALEQGELGLEEALDTVAGAHRQLARLRAELGGAPEASPVPRVRDALRGEAAALEPAAEEAWQQARAYLRRHFTGRFGMS